MVYGDKWGNEKEGCEIIVTQSPNQRQIHEESWFCCSSERTIITSSLAGGQKEEDVKSKMKLKKRKCLKKVLETNRQFLIIKDITSKKCCLKCCNIVIRSILTMLQHFKQHFLLEMLQHC